MNLRTHRYIGVGRLVLQPLNPAVRIYGFSEKEQQSRMTVDGMNEWSAST